MTPIETVQAMLDEIESCAAAPVRGLDKMWRTKVLTEGRALLAQMQAEPRTGNKGQAMTLPTQHLIGKLRHTQRAMRETAKLMREAGVEQHPDEMDGAANIIDSWIAGIQIAAAPQEPRDA